jgi:hypothetical protein
MGDIVLFHSSECDVPGTLAEGWWIGECHGDDLSTDNARGPYYTKKDAAQAMADGDWLL